MKQSWKRQFITIFAGQAFSVLGSAAVQFAIVWYLTVQTGSAVTLTLASIVGLLPNIVLGPFAGVWIDRFNRRTVMILADGLVALASIALGVMFLATPAPPLWFIYIILFVRGVGGTFHGPAMQAAVPTLVPPEMLTKAGGWSNMISSLGNMLGPVLGAALMGFMPIAAIMLIDIGGAAFAIVCLLFVKIPDIPRQEGKLSFWGDMKQGLLAMRNNKPLMAVFFPMMLVNILYMPLGSLFPLLVHTHFGGTAWHNSIVEFVFAAGLLVSSLVVGVWGGMKKRFLMISLSVVMLGVFSAVSGLLPAATWGFVLFGVCCFAMGACGTFINVPMMAYTQQTIAPDMLGKVLSLLITSMSLAMPFGLLVAGPVSEKIGVDNWFAYSGLAMVLVGVLCWVLCRRYDARPMPVEAGTTPENG